MDQKELIEKYNKRGPRYTSYPAYPYWENCPTEDQWSLDIKEGINSDNNIELYIHVPFCESLCNYCGCNRVITKNHDVEQEYISLIHQEWDWYQSKFPNIMIKSIHLGGGTPTFLSPENLKLLISKFKNISVNKDDFSGSIEVDPRVTSADHLKVLEELGFKRISMGIQDFNKDVQEAVNRVQSFELVENLVASAKKHNFNSINFDLIYGLPCQTVDSIKETMDLVYKLSPDSIAFYSYAHVPWKSKAQKSLEKFHLPTGDEKQKLYDFGRELFLEKGYAELGLDHFAKQTDELYLSKGNGSLFRNFMGYTTQKSNVLIGLGASSISSSVTSFIQNAHDLKEYKEKVKLGTMAITSGHKQTELDLITAEVVQQIMCLGKSNIDKLLNILPPSILSVVNADLQDIQNDQLILLNNNLLEVTDMGGPFLRNICMALDYRYINQKLKRKTFSQTI